MARKPESQFIASVHKHFGANAPYFEKNWNAYRGGTPDVFYSGNKGALWIEYKFAPKLPARSPARLDLSPLQRLWLRNRYHEGRNVAVILGLPHGGIVFEDKQWEDEALLADDLLYTSVWSREGIARWIQRRAGRRAT